MNRQNFSGRNSTRGSAAVVALVAITVLVGLCGAMLMIASRSNSEGGVAVNHHQATAVAQAGLNEALLKVAAGQTAEAEVGSEGAPASFGGGTYWVTVDAGDEACTVRAFADVRGEQENLEALLTGGGQDIYDHALFAGNTSGDPLYNLKLGGKNAQADQVTGDVYSGGNVLVTGTASVAGTIRADGTITGASGETGVTQPIPDLMAMDYANTADFKVASLFTTATYKSNALGGKAYQVPEANPAHIFRKNPNDRLSDINATVKNDYFLEDPYEPVHSDSGSTGADACPITISGVGGEPGVNGNQKVYYIDGNLWIHNKNVFSFKIVNDSASGVQVSFVVKGNIYFSDNVFYKNTAEDGVAFIAMKDSVVADSGNIYFGDPVFGTLEQMHAFMYAENNFIDKNLNAAGSAKVAVYGNMTAGNKVDIQRDFGTAHSKLTVNYDGRISNGDLKMPGLPGSGAGDDGAWTFQAMHRIGRP
ncbi:MAG: hypothetical protein EXS08_05830 [Planctomycetes bacterium]|nr:hypothetical protein [Planctomycetota bacterium]